MREMVVREELGAWAEEVGAALTAEAWERLEQVVQLWARYGAAFNLVGDTGRPALVEHVREGLMALVVAERAGWDGTRWLDVGSGAGIPGLVVAAVRGHVVMVEPRERRAAFLELAIGAIKATGCAVVRARLGAETWEKVASPELNELLAGDIRVLSAKAVMAVETWILRALNVAPRGIIVCHVRREQSFGTEVRVTASLAHGDRLVTALGAAD